MDSGSDNGSESGQALGLGGAPETVDPLIRAHILSLVSALGGSSPTGYELGDEAIVCLKDLRKWLRLYDEKLNRYDVARCMAEANLVKGDLLEIIASWGDEETEDRSKHRLVLACVELLVTLTWPFEKQNEQMTVNHHRHIPVLQHAQASYKSAILRHPSRKILANVVRIALPSMAILASERTERDEGIIRLILYFFRNLAIIEHPMPNETDTGEDINRSATIEVYDAQYILDLLLTMASGMGSEFNTQDVVTMEVIYHLVKSVDIEHLFLSETEEKEKKAQSLTALLKAEDEMKRSSSRNTSTRHNRFGTTVWVEKDDGRRAFVSGQGALLGRSTAQHKMDQSKKWRKPKGGDPKGLSRKTEFDIVLALDGIARAKLRTFVEKFLDAGFNPLFSHIRRAIDRDAERMLNTNQRQFFYLVAWFLKAERVRRKSAGKQPANAEDDSFGLIASVLNQEMLITLNRRMWDWFELKQWLELQPGMRCFTQILLTVHDMTTSPVEDDQEIAENIQNRLFYEETTLDLIIGILRSYTKQPFGWLDDCTEMVHVHLRMLEKYSKQHELMFVRSRRRQRAKKKDGGGDGDAGRSGSGSEEDITESRNTMSERAFNFTKFETKLLTQNCINTFLAFLDNYKELNYSQVKRAITFFHRIFVKRQEEVLLFRLDIVEQFYRIMQDPDGMPQGHPARKEMDQFVKYYLRRLVKKLEKRPEMFVELLFSKMNSTMHYLTHGYDKQVTVRQPRPAAELHIPDLPRNEQVGVAVGVLVDENKSDAVNWLKDQLTKAISERKAWEIESAARRILEEEAAADAGAELIPNDADKSPHITIAPDSDERKNAMFKDSKLRLLMTILGFEKLDLDENVNTDWIIPSDLTSEQLQESLDLLKKYTDEPITFDDGKLPEDLIKPKRKARKAFDSDEDEQDNQEEYLFEPGGPTQMKSLEPKKKKLGRKNRTRVDGDDQDLDEITEERRKKRLEREKEKRAAIKSDVYVHASDDESDVEKDINFFLREKAQREAGPAIMEDGSPLMTIVRKRKKKAEKSGKERKKKRMVDETDDGEEETVVVDDDDDDDDAGVISREATPVVPSTADLSSGGEDDSDSPVVVATTQPKSAEDVVMDDVEDEEDVAPRPGRGRRGPVIVDSDSE